MICIRVFRDHKEYNLQSVSKVQHLLSKIDFAVESEIELDLRECLIDYYATSKLLDKAIHSLAIGSDKGILRVKTDFEMGEAPLLNALFLGSEVFELTDDHELDVVTLKTRINPKLSALKICLEVSQYNLSGEQLITFQMGVCGDE